MAKMTIKQFVNAHPELGSESFWRHGVSTRTVPFIRMGSRKILLSEESIESWLESQAVEPHTIGGKK